ncbi:ATP-dependent protease La [Auriculariales sp. MPI-PUGE-AT-0066]|nr:ATP-dependent protease La [Auriculariales sp. MPI-PUGE-AT-0066]
MLAPLARASAARHALPRVARAFRPFSISARIAFPRWSNASAEGSGTQPRRAGQASRAAAKPTQKPAEVEEAALTPQNSIELADNEGESAGAPPASSSSGTAPPSDNGSSGESDGGKDGEANAPPPDESELDEPLQTSAISKQTVPEHYPQLLALPIARRPLFPGYYKAVVVKNPHVVAAIEDMLRRGQAYMGAFLLKDENSDSDVLTDIDSVHPVGVFAQITSVFPADKKDSDGKSDGKDKALTVVLYPHRRIKLVSLANGQNAASKVIVPPSESKDVSRDGQAHAIPPHLQTSFLLEHDVSVVNVENLTAKPYDKKSQIIHAVTSELISAFKDIAQINPLFRDQIANFSSYSTSTSVFEEPDKLADFAAAVSSGEVSDLQDVLESLDIEDRLQKALLVLKKELMNAQLQQKIARDVESKIQKRQREYYLMEQMKGIKKELGLESDGKDKLIEKLRERAAQLKMPESVRRVFDEELGKLQHLEPAAAEANVTRNYLDWLVSVPWGVHSPENFSIAHATTVLDEDHYGLRDVKDRILEFLAVGKLRGTVEGKILCFVGPPGVGKTSIGKSIARALNRQFFRFSVGGLTDVAEIKGHRRTYVGALPSKIIQALKRVGTENPLVLIDEVDKIGRGHNGDPSSALLEMLDPEQNSQFLDHYMDVPVDLSRVLFVCTANNLDTIPAPLLDRMEILEVSGYVSEEKLQIAAKYLAPQAKQSSGLAKADVVLEQDAVDLLIKYYCRESGVRNLKKHIEKIYRKTALKIVRDLGEDALPEQKVEATTTNPPATNLVPESQAPESQPVVDSSATEEVKEGESVPVAAAEEKPVEVTTVERKPVDVPTTVHVRINAGNLKEYVGPQIYHKDRLYVSPPPPGVSSGLGYLGNGSGSVMPIEATSMPGKGGLQLTGKLGEVIRESAQIALSWVKSHAFELGITQDPSAQFLADRDVHLHMPEGAIGKEGPSAGTAILSALVSLFTKTKVHPDIAMTGEISLVGQVLPVGGLKEKILAAHRAGIKKILAPLANQADIEENVPASVKEGIEFVFVDNVHQVLHEVFRDTAVAARWKETLPLEQPHATSTVAEEQQSESRPAAAA